MTLNSVPKRAVRLTLKLDTDDIPELVATLSNIATAAERGELTVGVSGGVSSGYVYELLQNPSQTHEGYFAEIRAYLDAQKKAAAARDTEATR